MKKKLKIKKKKAKMDPQIKKLKNQRKSIREMVENLRADAVPFVNARGSLRFMMCQDLLSFASDHPFKVGLVKAALELNAYNDVVAEAFLNHAAENEYSELINNERLRIKFRRLENA